MTAVDHASAAFSAARCCLSKLVANMRPERPPPESNGDIDVHTYVATGIDLRVTNTSEYRGWNTRLNGTCHLP